MLLGDLNTFSKSDKLKLLLDLSAKVVDQSIFDPNFLKQMVNSIVTQQENAMKQQQLTTDGRFPCRYEDCQKSFKYNGSSRRRHKLSHDHPVQISEKLCDMSPIKPDAQKPTTNSDDLYNYNTALLSDGFLFQNFIDAISEGNGERTMRQYKYIMLYC